MTKQSDSSALIVNGRMTLLNGPTFLITLFVLVSAIESSGDLRPGEVDLRTVVPIDRVVRPRIGDDFGDHRTGGGIDDIPVRAFERGYIEKGAVRRDGQPVASTLVGVIPEDSVGQEIDADDAAPGWLHRVFLFWRSQRFP